MRAIQIVDLSGPDTALRLADIPEPAGDGVVIDVRAAGVSFPEVLQTRGAYQLQPELPFVPGSEVAGVVRGDHDGFEAGDRVVAFDAVLGGFAEVVVANPRFTFRLSDRLDFAEGAGLILNYHTAYFALTSRGRLRAGETVLVHGAAGGVGTAALQVAKGLGARTIAVVSTDAKAEVARKAGADEIVRSDGPWKDEVKRLGGADVVLDPVGGDRFTDSLRSLNVGGRAVVVGFTGGSIPEVKVNRLLLGNLEVVGAGLGAYLAGHPEYAREAAAAIDELVEAGHVRPLVGARLPLEQAATALKLIEQRNATGKVVLTL